LIAGRENKVALVEGGYFNVRSNTVKPVGESHAGLDPYRNLSPKTLAIMTADQIPPNASRSGDITGLQDIAPFTELGQSYVLGVAIRTQAGQSPVSGSVGDYFWAGYGMYFWIDPKEKLFAVMMVQMDFDQSGRYRRTLREMVYGALVP
jgi:CubicO group peptidase (beta-lactamase class C family)